MCEPLPFRLMGLYPPLDLGAPSGSVHHVHPEFQEFRVLPFDRISDADGQQDALDHLVVS
jgi:hypothetical protein